MKDHLNQAGQLDLSWTLSLFGAATGAGILFLPVRAGLSGLWVTLAIAALVYPAVYFAHRLFAGLLVHAAQPGDFAAALREFLGPRAGTLVAVLFPGLLLMLLVAYTTALNNSLGDYLAHQVPMATGFGGKAVMPLLILLCLLGLLRFGKRWVIRTLGALSAVLIVLLLCLSVLMARYWRLDGVLQLPSVAGAPRDALRLFPIMMESFIFFPALSSLVLVLRRQCPTAAGAEQRAARIIRRTTGLLLGFVLLFVLSCLFALTPDDMRQAAARNFSVLDMLGTTTPDPLLAALGPLVAMLALVTSFLGLFLGYQDSLSRLIGGMGLSAGMAENLLYGFTLVVLWGFVVFDIPVLGLLGQIGGPLSAIFLFLLPAAAYLKRRDRLSASKPVLTFVLICGGIQLLASGLASL